MLVESYVSIGQFLLD